MRWKRRRTIWPPLIALVALSLLTLAAPQAWQRYCRSNHSQPAASQASVAQARSEVQPPDASQAVEPPARQQVEVAQPARSDFPPPLPPVVRKGARHLKPDAKLIAPVAAPILDDEYADYDLEDYSVVEAPRRLPVPEPLQQPASPTAPSSELTSVEFSMPPAVTAAPRQIQTYSLETLLSMRVAMQSFLDGVHSDLKATKLQQAQLQQTQIEQSQAKEQHSRPEVRVESSSDRLAMVTERSIVRTTPKPTKVAPKDQPPKAATRVTPREPRLAQAPPRPSTQAAADLRTRPEALIDQLTELSQEAPTHQWAEAALRRVERLATPGVGGDPLATVAELVDLAGLGREQASELRQPALRTKWLRTVQALERRLPVWELLLDPIAVANAASESLGGSASSEANDSSQFAAVLQELSALTADSSEGTAWREFLRLHDLADYASESPGVDLNARRETAQQVLARMNDPRLTAPQREFLHSPPLMELAGVLRLWSAGPVRLEALAALIERYERNTATRYAQAIAQMRQRLQWSANSRMQRLAEHLDRSYRNANLRLAVTDELLNRLTPKTNPIVSPVHDRIGGAEIHGRAETTTDVSIHLVPDPNAWRIALQADGDVRSDTYSDTWPARVRNAGQLRFAAIKEIVVTRTGLQTAPAQARAQGRNNLVGIDSQFAPVPLLGPLVESIARQKHRQSQGPALAKVKRRVVREAKTRMDQTADARVSEIESGFKTHVLSPLETLALAAEPVDMYTTDRRAVMRLRMAGEAQLAAHTPRPSAPSDSLASFQLHESALNNGVGGLGLNGRRMSAGMLHSVLSRKLAGAPAKLPIDLDARARVEFSKYDAVRLRCDGDRFEIILNIAELSRGRDRIRDFQVHAFFRPRLDGLQVTLVRDGNLQFAGPRLRTGPRMVLHSVFGRLLHEIEELPLLSERLQNDLRFEGLMVTQLVIEDGWIAVALGPYHPQRIVWRTRKVNNAALAREASDNDLR